jgi:anti-anti-sigma factor
MPPRLWGVQIESQTQESVLILTIAGRLGHQAATALRDALNETGDSNGSVIVDLERVDYISGPALAAFQAAARGRPGAVVLFGATAPVRIAFELAGLHGDIAIEATREAALARVHDTSGRN